MNDSEERKERVKAWLKAAKKSREWLAKELDLSINAINKWFDRRIPDGRYAQIESLMRASSAPQFSCGVEMSPFSVEVIAARFTCSEYESIEKAARAEGYSSLEDYVRDSVIERAQEVLEAKETPQHATPRNEASGQ